MCLGGRTWRILPVSTILVVQTWRILQYLYLCIFRNKDLANYTCIYVFLGVKASRMIPVFMYF
jgi:hypothetical protein